MHEMGIVTHTLKTVEAFSEENGITEVAAVSLQIGEVSGIMDDLFVDAWAYFRPKYKALGKAELRIEKTKAVTWCNCCKSTYETVSYGRTCPNCGSGETWLLRGNECVIKEIEVPDIA